MELSLCVHVPLLYSSSNMDEAQAVGKISIALDETGIGDCEK